MASEIALLIPDFRKQLIRSLAAAKERGLQIEVVTTLVTPLEQGALWRQGRSRTDAELKVMALENAKAKYLADCLRRAIPKATNQVTDLLPGMSWFQWGEAAEVVWIDGSRRVNWSSKTEVGRDGNGYKTFAAICEEFSIHSAGEFNDSDAGWRTIQLRHSPSPSDIYTLADIDAEMKRRYGK